MPTLEAEKLALLVTLLEPEMASLGFQLVRSAETFRRTRGEVTQRLAVSRCDDSVTLFPAFVFPEVQKLAARLQRQPERKGWPTAAANIGVLRPNGTYQTWKLRDVVARGKLVRELKSRIRQDAVPYWDDFATLDALANRVAKRDRRVCSGHTWPWEAAAALCLKGRFDEAVALLADVAEDRIGRDRKRLERTIPRVQALAEKAGGG